MSPQEELAALLDELGADRARAPGPWLVVAAHPVDETLGASWIMRRARDTRVLLVTDGAPRDRRLWSPRASSSRRAYAAMRALEVRRALALAGVGANRITSLGIMDQEASDALVELAVRIEQMIAAAAPAVVVTHPYEGGHPDHDAVAFAVQAALQHLAKCDAPVPERLEMTSYHRHDAKLEAGAFLTSLPRQAHRPLTAHDQAVKGRMLACFASQVEVLAAFDVAVERFRRAPRYDFTAPPHDGTLQFEALGWPMTGTRWRRLASGALERLAEREC